MNQDPNSRPGRDDANNCFVCSPSNPLGLHVPFHLDGEICRGQFTPAADHCGYDGITHGGIIFSLLDDVMANWLYLNGLRCYTAKCEIRYRSPLPTGCRVLLVGQSLGQKRKVVMMEGIATREDTGETIAQCEASFLVQP